MPREYMKELSSSQTVSYQDKLRGEDIWENRFWFDYSVPNDQSNNHS